MRNWTKGKWIIHPTAGWTDMEVTSNERTWISSLRYISNDNEVLIAEVPMRCPNQDGGYPLPDTNREMLANSQMIAAAPQMFETLEAIYDFLVAEGYGGGRLHQQVREILDAAENGVEPVKEDAA